MCIFFPFMDDNRFGPSNPCVTTGDSPGPFWAHSMTFADVTECLLHIPDSLGHLKLVIPNVTVSVSGCHSGITFLWTSFFTDIPEAAQAGGGQQGRLSHRSGSSLLPLPGKAGL